MKFLRSCMRKLACILMVVVLCVIGYNLALRHIYPLKYSDIIERQAAEYGIDEFLIAAVIRCESGFDRNAESKAGAVGLMQLTEETFYDMNKLLCDGDRVFETDCYIPSVNIEYGTAYLKYLFGIYGDDKLSVLAAYNAGPGNVASWVGDNVRLEREEIEFKETAEYVDRVLKAEEYYRKLYSRKEK